MSACGNNIRVSYFVYSKLSGDSIGQVGCKKDASLGILAPQSVFYIKNIMPLMY